MIDAQKTPVQLRRRDGRRAAARKQVADEIAFLRRTADNAFQQLERLLGLVSGALGIFLLQMADIVPDVAGIGGLIVVIAVFFAAGHDRAIAAPVFIHGAAHMVAARLVARNRHGLEVEIIRSRPRIKQNHVVLARKIAARTAARLIAPDDFIEEIALAENLVHQQPQMRVHPAVDMQKDGAFLFKQFAGKQQRLFHHRQIFRAIRPAVVISGQIEAGRSVFIAAFANAHLHIELLARVKRRIKVDGLHLPSKARQQSLPLLRHFCLDERAHALPTHMALCDAADICAGHGHPPF